MVSWEAGIADWLRWTYVSTGGYSLPEHQQHWRGKQHQG